MGQVAVVFALLMSTLWLVVFAQASRDTTNTTTHRHRIPILNGNCTTNRSSVLPVILLSPHHHETLIHKSLQAHDDELHRALEVVSRALDTVGRRSSILAERLRTKITRLAAVYEHDMETLRSLLLRGQTADDNESSSSSWLRALPSSVDDDGVDTLLDGTANENGDESTTNWARFNKQQQDAIPYDSIRQVVAHIVRDWTHEGASIRNALYPWILSQLRQYAMTTTTTNSPILVPGAGLGRLAYEIALQNKKCSVAVEAVESSVIMVTMAQAIFSMQHKQQCQLHPYAADPFANEVDSNLRYTAVSFPDTVVLDIGNSIHTTCAPVSYTVANFGPQYYYNSNKQSYYSAVVTCFFLDTATTVLDDYLSTIAHIVMPGGLWINVGPLHWHPNTVLPLTVDELLAVLQDDDRWDILEWTVDITIVPYRDSRMGASTHAGDGYRPLRFVLRKKQG